VRFSLFAKTLYLLTRVALPPIVLAHVSLADYGIWAVAFIVVSYLGLTATGFASVYVRRGALAHSSHDIATLSRLMSTGMLSLGLMSVVLFTALTLGLPWVMERLAVQPEQRDTALWLVLGASGVFLTDITLGAYAYLLHGMGRIRDEQKIWVIAYLVEMALVVGLLTLGWGIRALLVAFALRYVVSIGAAARLVHRSLPGLKLGWGQFDGTLLREFFGFGLIVQISALCANALHSAERVLAGALLGAPAAALFDLGNKLPSTATSIPSAVSTVALPAAARSQSAEETRALYLNATRMTGLLTALPMPFLALFALPLCQFWLGQHPQVHMVAGIMTVLSVSCHVHILTGPGSSIFRGTGSASNEFIYHGLRVFTLALAVGGLVVAGQVSVPHLAQAVAGATCVAALLYLLWNHHRLGCALDTFARHVLWPAAVAYPVGIALAWGLHAWWPTGMPNRWELLPLLTLAFALYVVSSCALMWSAVLTREERLTWAQRGRAVWQKLQAKAQRRSPHKGASS
jgi:O-antigen/teichoic acid export membrane protein